MALTTTYYDALDGRIIGERTAGVQTDYLTDALGSVTATVDQNVAIVNEYRYKPYGSFLSRSGVGSDPAFLWVGSLGYRETGLEQSEYYVRARQYSTLAGRWTAVDPGPPDSASYNYAGASPTSQFDPDGLSSRSIKCILGVEVTDNPKECDKVCAKSHITTNWTIFPKKGCKGFIVQKVHKFGEYTGCLGLRKTKFGPYKDVWEAWEVDDIIYRGYKSRGKVGSDDTFEFNANIRCGCGFHKFEGEARFYPGIKINWKEGGDPTTFILPSTNVEPDFWKKDPGGAIFKTNKTSFACCDFPQCPERSPNKCTHVGTAS